MLTPPQFAFAIAVAAAKWVSNPFHDDAVAIAIAVAVDAPQCEHPPWFALKPFMTAKILVCR